MEVGEFGSRGEWENGGLEVGCKEVEEIGG